MNFETLKRRVERREQLVEGRALKTQNHWTSLKTTWRESWTPGRILLAGLVAGFLVGRAEPARALRKLGGLGGTRWLQLIGPLSGLLASLQASFAARAADDASDDAAEAADAAGDAGNGSSPGPGSFVDEDASPLPRADRRRPDPVWTSQPPAAEAATDLSER